MASGLDGAPVALSLAASGRARELFELLSNDNTELQTVDAAGLTPLHSAVFVLSGDCVRVLLAARAAVDVGEAHGASPLQIAAAMGAVDILSLLLRARASVDWRDSGGQTALHAASSTDDTAATVQLLIDARADVDARDAHGTTALAVAVASNSIACTRMLCYAKANVDLADTTGTAPLCLAAALGHGDCATLLLDAHASADHVDANGFSSLHAACEMGQGLLAWILLSRGAIPSPRDASSGSTPLLLAATYGHLECLVQLVGHGAELDDVDSNGVTALIAASRGGHARVVSALLDAKANPEVATRDGRTALSLAVAAGHAEAGSMLLEAHDAAKSRAAKSQARAAAAAAAAKAEAIAKAQSAEVNSAIAAEARKKAEAAEAAEAAAEAQAAAATAAVVAKAATVALTATVTTMHANEAIAEANAAFQEARSPGKSPSRSVGKQGSPKRGPLKPWSPTRQSMENGSRSHEGVDVGGPSIAAPAGPELGEAASAERREGAIPAANVYIIDGYEELTSAELEAKTKEDPPEQAAPDTKSAAAAGLDAAARIGEERAAARLKRAAGAGTQLEAMKTDAETIQSITSVHPDTAGPEEGAVKEPSSSNAAVVAAALAALPIEAETDSLYDQHVRRAKEQLAQRRGTCEDLQREERRELEARYPVTHPSTRPSVTRVAFNGQVDDEQERRRNMKLRRQKAAIHIQSCYRRYHVRRTLRALNHLTTIIQKHARAMIARVRVAEVIRTGAFGDKPKPREMISEVQRVELANRWASVFDPSPLEVDNRPAESSHMSVQDRGKDEAGRQPQWRNRPPLARKKRPTAASTVLP